VCQSKDYLHIAISGLVQNYHNRPLTDRYYRMKVPQERRPAGPG